MKKASLKNKKTPPSLDVMTAPGTSMQSVTYLGNLLSPNETVLDEKGGNPKLYAQILRDDQVKSTLQQRFSALTSKEWEVVPGGADAIDIAAADFLRAELEDVGWTRKVGKMAFGIFYGYAVAEILWQISDNGLLSFKDIRVRKRHRFKFDVEGNLRLITKDNPQGRLLPDRKMWSFSTGADNDDQPYGMGLAHWLYWPCLFKREGIKFWMMFLDKFGSPTPVGKYPANATQAEKEQLLAATQAFQQESGIIIPEGMLIELIEATRGGRVDYAVQYNAMDAAISKVVLSQTMTTDSGSSLSQSQTHEGVRDDVVESDGTEICDSFNRGPVTWITEYNFPAAKIPEVRFITEDAEDLNAVADRDIKLDQLGFPPTENHIHETYGEGYQKSEAGNQTTNAVRQGRPPARSFSAGGGDPHGVGGESPVKQKKSETGSQNFAETLKLAPARDDIDDFVDAHINDFQDQVGADIISIINDVAARSTDFDNFIENLLEATSDIKMEKLTDLLARSGFNARLQGNVKK